MGNPCSPACSTRSNHVSYWYPPWILTGCCVKMIHVIVKVYFRFLELFTFIIRKKILQIMQANSLGMEGRSSNFSFFTFCFDFMNLLSFIFRSLLSGCTFYLLRNHHKTLSIWKLEKLLKTKIVYTIQVPFTSSGYKLYILLKSSNF